MLPLSPHQWVVLCYFWMCRQTLISFSLLLAGVGILSTSFWGNLSQYLRPFPSDATVRILVVQMPLVLYGSSLTCAGAQFKDFCSYLSAIAHWGLWKNTFSVKVNKQSPSFRLCLLCVGLIIIFTLISWFWQAWDGPILFPPENACDGVYNRFVHTVNQSLPWQRLQDFTASSIYRAFELTWSILCPKPHVWGVIKKFVC